MNKNYTIRLERESDYRTVENLTREAFWNVYQPGCTEHYVLHRYRSNPDLFWLRVFIYITTLSLEKAKSPISSDKNLNRGI